jgi:hypothetical protein
MCLFRKNFQYILEHNGKTLGTASCKHVCALKHSKLSQQAVFVIEVQSFLHDNHAVLLELIKDDDGPSAQLYLSNVIEIILPDSTIIAQDNTPTQHCGSRYRQIMFSALPPRLCKTGIGNIAIGDIGKALGTSLKYLTNKTFAAARQRKRHSSN